MLEWKLKYKVEIINNQGQTIIYHCNDYSVDFDEIILFVPGDMDIVIQRNDILRIIITKI